jgi:hypothetical protein
MLYLALCAVCSVLASAESRGADDRLGYNIDYLISVHPTDNIINVELNLDQSKNLLREVSMRPDFERISNFNGDGDIEIDGQQLRWKPPASGGSLRWRVRINHLRNESGYDAWLGPQWGLFRAEDVIPRASTRTLKGARSKTQLTFELPRSWNVVTQYYGQDGQFAIDNAERHFDEPSGWIVTGQIGVRRDTIAGTRVAVAGPVENSVRRLDTLAMLNWTLPELARLLGHLPTRLSVMSAGEPMWRGGLSAPQSLFIHADRPLISENATSTLLHEVMHVALGVVAAPGYDWIVEGLAEYYSLELLGRSGTISAKRHRLAREQQALWAKDASGICGQSSTGATTALAVTVLAELDQELRNMTNGEVTLDDVAREISAAREPVDLNLLVRIVNKLTFNKTDTLRIENLPGCRSIAPDTSQP